MLSLKKLMIAATLVLAGLTAAAQGQQSALSSVSAQAQPEAPQLVKQNLAAAKVAPEPATARPLRAKARKALELPSVLTAVERDYSRSTGKMSSRGAVTIVPKSDGTATVYNLFGLADTLQATFDLSTLTVSLTPKAIYHSATYGDVWACSISETSDGKLAVSTTNPIKGTINAELGTVTITNWAVIVPTGKYLGYGFGIFSKSDFLPTNATMTEVLNHTGVDSTITYPVLLEQTYSNQLRVSNFVSQYGATVDMRLNADKTVEIAPQYMFTNVSYGDFMCYNANWTTGKMVAGNIPGTGTATSISWGNWAVLDRGTHSLLARRDMSSHIDFAEGLVSWPAAPVLDWTGEGTEASPYIITTAQQLADLGESVAAGNSYTGKFIALGADIDLSTLKQVLRPIGATEAKSFNGSFDGRGYTVSGLTLATGEENYQGLFGFADSASVIKNLKVKGFNISSYGQMVGAVAGVSAGTFTGVTVTDTKVTGNGPIAGGVIGEYRGLNFSEVSFTGTVSGVGATGGIAGEMRGNMSRCQSHGLVTMPTLLGTTYRGVGGLVGSTLPMGKRVALITDCWNDATVNDATGFGTTGGVVGSLLTGTLQRSFNMGQVTSKATTELIPMNPVGTVGGIVGMTYGSSVIDCYNGNIVANSGSSERVGGIVGYTVSPNIVMNTKGDTLDITYKSHIIDCINYGQVHMPTVTATQGLYGAVYADSVIENSYFDRQITGNEMPASGKKWSLETAQLIGGTAPEGLSNSIWLFEQGRYPRLKAIPDNASALLGSIPATLATGETTRKVKHGFKLSSGSDVVWGILDQASGQAVTETAGIKLVDGDSIALKDTNSSEIIVATSASAGISKLFNIETVNPAGFLGSGTEDDPYLITDPDDLRALNKGVSEDKQTYKGDYFRQTNDISLADAPDFIGICPAATKTLAFEGTYDGGGHSITHFVIDSVGRDANTGKTVFKGGRNNAGLFGYIGASGTVKNLTIDSTCSITGYMYIGSIAGHSDGTIEGCRNFGTITSASSYSGGIVGYQAAGGTVTGCYNGGTVATGGNNAGGIVGYNYGTVSYCQNDGRVLADSTRTFDRTGRQKGAAGIVATNMGKECKVLGNINTGSIYAVDKVAGITLQMSTSGSEATKNINYGTVDYGTPSSEQRGTIIAMTSLAATSQSNYYDAQLGYYGAMASAPGAGMTGLSTKQLTSGQAPEGIDTAYVDFQPGLYPVLKRFAAEPAAQAHRKMIVTFADANTADDVTEPATLKADSTLTWTLESGNPFAIASGRLTVGAVTGQTSARDVLTATIGRYTKSIGVRAVPSVFVGKGTNDDPFQIRNKADMMLLARMTNDEGIPYTGKYFKVMNDIDFDSTAYTPVAFQAHQFNADFDGDGHKFININYTLPAKNTTGYFGLFGNVDAQGYIHDMTLESGTIQTYNGAAGFVGKLWGKAERLVNKATITTGTTSTAGGIVGAVKYGGLVKACQNMGQVVAAKGSNGGIAYNVEAGGTIDSCQNLVDMTTSTAKLAGIAVNNYGTITRCDNYGQLVATGMVAGIVCTDYAGTISQCHNHANLGDGTQNNVAGILTAADRSITKNTVITDCTNSGEINGKGTVCGIAANTYGFMAITNCHNTGNITAGTGAYAGGIMGFANSTNARPVVINGCTNSGSVVSGGNRVGGLFGELNYGSEAHDCYNYGNVLGGGNYVGGVCGDMSGKLYRCYNVADVEGAGYGVGGLGGINYGEIHQSFNAGQVSSDYAKTVTTGIAGGVAAYSVGGYYSTYNLGDVTAPDYVGGIVGQSFRDTRMINIYNAGAVKSTTQAVVGNVGCWSTTPVLTKNLYYDNTINPTLPEPGEKSLDLLAKGLNTRALTTSAELTDTFTLRPGMYPTLAVFRDDPLANFFAATVVLQDGDTYDHVKADFQVGVPDSTVWTCTPAGNLDIDADGHVYPRALGKVVLTKTFGNYTRSYELNIDKTNGVDELNADVPIVSQEYYSLSGVSLGQERPVEPGVYVQVTNYQGGTRTSTKIVVR